MAGVGWPAFCLTLSSSLKKGNAMDWQSLLASVLPILPAQYASDLKGSKNPLVLRHSL